MSGARSSQVGANAGQMVRNGKPGASAAMVRIESVAWGAPPAVRRRATKMLPRAPPSVITPPATARLGPSVIVSGCDATAPPRPRAVSTYARAVVGRTTAPDGPTRPTSERENSLAPLTCQRSWSGSPQPTAAASAVNDSIRGGGPNTSGPQPESTSARLAAIIRGIHATTGGEAVRFQPS